MHLPFQNRTEAGRLLAKRLQPLALKQPIVLALPRGGVPIGLEVARELGAPLDVLIVRKIGSPTNPEYGIGAITESGYYGIDEEAARATGTSTQGLKEALETEYEEVRRRVRTYRGARPLPPLRGKTIIVVDDGLATGVTARIACRFLKAQGAASVVLAVPVCSPRTTDQFRSEVDEVVCLEEPEIFFSVGEFYEDFSQISDEEVVSLLGIASERSEKPPIDLDTMIKGRGIALPAHLSIPSDAQGIVIFAHGSGSSRFSPRNQQVARTLNEARFGTLLFDLLTPDESSDRSNVFDIPLLASRLVLATHWLRAQDYGRGLPIGFFGASTGAGAALWAAADLGQEVSAIASRGGRPDLAIPRLPEVVAPTLLIVGGQDEAVIGMNEEALRYLKAGELVIIPGATHLFEEPGALEAVSRKVVSWFSTQLKRGIVRPEAA